MYRKGARVALACALAALAAALAAGCGGLASGEDDGGAGSAAAAASSARASGAAGVKDRPGQPSRQDRGGDGAVGCRSAAGPLLAELEDLRRSLVAGLDYRAYLERLRKLRSAYERVPVGRLPLACLERVAAPAEVALNRYIAALNLWADCVEEPGCSAAAVEVPLQRRWRDAARHLSRARRGLG